MSVFTFDPTRSAQENIAAFCAHIVNADPELGSVLVSALEHVMPLPEGSAARNANRTKANREIAAALDAMEAGSTSLADK